MGMSKAAVSILTFIICLILAALGFALLGHAADKFTDGCKAEGGHVQKVAGYKTTTYICLTPDNRVLHIKNI